MGNLEKEHSAKPKIDEINVQTMSKLPNEKEFLKRYNLAEDSLEKAGLEWKQLEEIHLDYSKRISELEPVANYIAATIQRVPEVHSIRFRIKDSEHLTEKMIRKKLEDSTREYSVKNYSDQITDLIGVRALHLFKQDWENIHDFLVSNFDFAEKPIANVREGDSKEFRRIYEEKGCEVKEHKAGYRSVHYLIKSKPAKQEFIIELQVRTIFEEGWSEIDHRIRYPYDQENLLLGQLLGILNRLAGSADEMSTYITLLKSELARIEQKNKETIIENEKAKTELNDALQKLEISEQEKSKLRQRLEGLFPTFQVDSNLMNLALGNIAGIITPLALDAMRNTRLSQLSYIENSNENSEKETKLNATNKTLERKKPPTVKRNNIEKTPTTKSKEVSNLDKSNEDDKT